MLTLGSTVLRLLLGMSYQTFDNVIGSSQSGKKWEALKIDSLVKGKSVLDVGCNEGYFCQRVQTMGATRILGVDLESSWIEKAKKRNSNANIEFRQLDWNHLSTLGETFNVVLLLSSFHYACETSDFEADGSNKLINAITKVLSPGGLLVLECGVAAGDSDAWVSVQRCADTRRFPTLAAILKLLKRAFAGDTVCSDVRCVGSSVTQTGDPTPRYVFHCRKAST